MRSSEAQGKYTEAAELSKNQRHTEALDILDDLDRRFPDTHKILLARARCLAALRRTVEARALADRVATDFDDEKAAALRDKLDEEEAFDVDTWRPAGHALGTKRVKQKSKFTLPPKRIIATAGIVAVVLVIAVIALAATKKLPAHSAVTNVFSTGVVIVAMTVLVRFNLWLAWGAGLALFFLAYDLNPQGYAIFFVLAFVVQVVVGLIA